IVANNSKSMIRFPSGCFPSRAWDSLHAPSRPLPNPTPGGASFSWERLWEPEPWEHAVVEAGHGADPIPGEGEDEESGSVADAARGGAKIGAERRLTICLRRHKVMRSMPEEAGQEAGRGVAAEVFEGNRRHRDAHIGGEQGHQPVDVTGLPCANELCD